ncbi:MAG: tRNA pseudouridine(38-40) synthase TruA [Ferruginibacter sp.]|nr:tRNA pseudouridine(38-40) synthase TruA [Ferruginibacter sp.]
MLRFFIEVAYRGTAYAGFQIQENANTVQSEIEKAMGIFFRTKFELTGSSRTDAGVHAFQNFFHFDADFSEGEIHAAAYHLNAILPDDIVVKKIFRVADDAHCRFDAISRTYEYNLYHFKNPFLKDTAYFFPYPVDLKKMNEAAELIKQTHHFESFCKKNVQVRHYLCDIMESEWLQRDGATLVYRVRGNRFLRGMVRGLVGTILRVGRGRLSLTEFKDVIVSNNPSRVDFSVPAHGLSLMSVDYGGEVQQKKTKRV